MPPLIGIIGQVDPLSGRLFVDGTHLRIISSIGGIPVVFGLNQPPYDVVTNVDGVLLIDGPDVHPYFYGEDPSNSLRAVDTERDDFEVKLVKLAVKAGLPLLGMGRGMHVINVALGGTLYQDLGVIPKAVKHDWDPATTNPRQRVHQVRIKTSSKLYEILRQEINVESTNEVYIGVNSFHHQAVKRVGEGIKPVAYSVDGLIEAVEGTEGFILGVQWRPEYLPEMKRLYEAFIKAAAEYRVQRRELERAEIEAEIREELTGGLDETRRSSETNGSLPDTNQT
ncbi:gamma-glutamyl-gamma-aminobutyrate hydrolase family protein [Thermococcus sp. M36]|uniref:gamma-glutamyl-gamma-aminobutyrate hydrolase family protein n=1 Tax=Thermococcus sp. M36 TaxID=1638261 RepID=UPI00143ACDE8|nr:gamma-glutamyl-gamma-aminobutyrate hydrolase family protein [Thermococcus sp. M36]NJE05175.1 gamma-glutamyl-gamma-aminobutyrate hydrolase family protein [Thermococcus sp. M36]